MASRNHLFARDFMSYVANKYAIDWAPPDERNAQSSPFTALMGMGIDAYLRAWDHAIMQSIRNNITQCRESDEQFKSFSYRTFDCHNAHGNDRVFFTVITYLARVATILYMDGMHRAPHVVVEVIESTSSRFQSVYGIDLYQKFHEYCLDLTTLP